MYSLCCASCPGENICTCSLQVCNENIHKREQITFHEMFEENIFVDGKCLVVYLPSNEINAI